MGEGRGSHLLTLERAQRTLLPRSEVRVAHRPHHPAKTCLCAFWLSHHIAGSSEELH